MQTLGQKILIIAGSTATGKSEYAINYALKHNGEIIGADSVQIYRRLDIGSGKVLSSEMKGVRHHMIDILDPHEEYSVSDYVSATKTIINQISDRGRLPIIVGGTGLYIRCLIEGHNFGEAIKDEQLRAELKQQLDAHGKEYMHGRLKEIDPISAEKISVNDTKRVIRALEIYHITGTPKSAAAKTRSSDYDFQMLALNKDRERLYRDINARVDKMFDAGLVDEVNSLLAFKDCQSMQAIGYKETVEYLEGKRTLDETKELIKLNTRHYAKRQQTFIRGFSCEKTWIEA